MAGIFILSLILFIGAVKSGHITGERVFFVLMSILVILGGTLSLLTEPGLSMLALIAVGVILAIVKSKKQEETTQYSKNKQDISPESVEPNFVTEVRTQAIQNNEDEQRTFDSIKQEALACASEDIERIKEEIIQKAKHGTIAIKNGRRYVSVEVECKYPLTCISFCQYRNQGHPEKPMENMYYLTISLSNRREYKVYIDELMRLAQKEGICIRDQMVRQYGHPSGGERISELPKRYNSFGRMSESYRFLVVCEVEL